MKKKWNYEEAHPDLRKMYGWNFKVYEDNGAQSPVCAMLCSTSDEQSEHLIDRQRAAAQLIAAAPELLEALQGLVEVFDYKTQNIYMLAKNDIDKAQRAINKALGKGAEL